MRGTLFALGSRVVGGLCTGAITVFLARELGSSGYGVYGLVLSIEALLLLVSDFGVVQAIGRFVAATRGDPDRLGEYVGTGLRLKLLGSISAGVVLVVIAPVIAHAYHAPRLSAGLRYTALTLFGMNVLLLCATIFATLRRQSLTLAAFTGESIVELLATVVFVTLFGTAVSAVGARAIGYLCGAALGLVLTLRVIGPVARRAMDEGRTHLREVGVEAVAVAIVDSAFTLFSTIDSLLIGAFLTVTSVGIWQGPLRLVALLGYPGQALASVVAPRLVASRGHPAEPEAFAAAVRVLVILMAAVIAATTVWAAPIVRLLLGASFAHSAAVLRALAPYTFLTGLGFLVTIGMNFLGQSRRRIPIAIATALVNVVIDVILIPQIGVLGGAIGTDVAFSIYVPVHFAVCQRELGVPLRPILRTAGGSFAAAGAMAAVLFAFGTESLGVPDAVLGGAAGLTVFAAVLMLTRTVTPAELRELRAWM